MTSVAVHDALHDGQPGARSFELVAVQALKRSEQLLGVTGIETGPVVANEKSAVRLPDFDPRGVAAAREFRGIPQQILEHDRNQVRIADRRQTGLDDELDGPVGEALAAALS